MATILLDRQGMFVSHWPHVRRGLMWRAVLLIIALGTILAMVITKRLSVINDSQERLICKGQLTAIQLALFLYQEKYGRFPPAHVSNKEGKPMHSWRVLLLEFLDDDLHKKYDFSQPWDGPANSNLAVRMPSCYALEDLRQQPSYPFTTRFAVIEGKDLVFEGQKTTALNQIEEPANTILVVETINSGIQWMEPRDLDINTIGHHINGQAPAISTSRLGGPIVLLANGDRLFLRPDAAFSDIHALLRVKGPKDFDRWLAFE